MQANCKAHFQTDEAYSDFWKLWLSLCDSADEEIFVNRWRTIRESVSPPVVDYLKSSWLQRHRQHFVKAWISKGEHYGHAVTSRVEAIHVFLKQWIAVPAANLHGVYGKFLLAQRIEISRQISVEMLRVPIRF